MKRLSVILLSIMLCLAAASCSGSGNTSSSTGEEMPKTQVFNSMTDYSGVQGYRNWYYLSARDYLSEAEYMIWDADMCTWRMSDPNCLIEYNIVHPGQLDQVVRAWRAPAAGSVSFTTKLQRRPVDRNGQGQDGCYAYIALGDEDDDVLSRLVVPGTDIKLHEEMHGELEVQEGQMIYYVLNCSGNYTFDQTYWEINIVFTRN